VKVGRVQYQNRIEVEVFGVDDDSWQFVKERLLFLTPPKNAVQVGSGRILLDEEYKGKLYCRGIYVGKLPGDYQFGYDLPVELDRDRSIADPWSLRAKVREAVMAAVNKKKVPRETVLAILEDHPHSGEAVVFQHETQQYNDTSSSDFRKEIVEAFTEKYGEGAVPVGSMGDSMEAKHHGLKGVVSPTPLREVFEAQEGSFEELKVKAATDVSRQLGIDDLEDAEAENLRWAADLVEPTTGEFNGLNSIQVVEFVGQMVLGQFRGGEILLARRVVSDRRELIATLVHEVAHHWGEDGSVEHRDAIDRIFAEIVVNATGGAE
jgi:hypothetical protein